MLDGRLWLRRSGRFLEALNCGALVVDRDGCITRLNNRASEMIRRPRGDIRGRNLLDFYDSPDGRAFILERRQNFKQPWEGEFYLPLPDGSRLPVIVSSRVLGAEPPLCDLRLITLIDVSAQKLAEASLREQYEIIAKLS